MNIDKSINKLPESFIKPNRTEASAGPAKTQGESHAHPAVETEGAASEVHQSLHDSLDAPCPGNSKPNIVDLFGEDGGGMSVQTLRYPENGEFPAEIEARTLMNPENGESKPGSQVHAQTLRFPEDGGFSVKPGKIPGHHEHHHGQTKALGENGEARPGKPPGLQHEHHHAQTKALGENGEAGPGKPPGLQHEHHHAQTKALGENGEAHPGRPGKLPPIHMTKSPGENGDWGKPIKPGPGFDPFQPGKPGFGKPGLEGSFHKTLAYPEGGESWGKPGKLPPSPPCKCGPELHDEMPKLKPWPGTDFEEPKLKPWPKGLDAPLKPNFDKLDLPLKDSELV